jgi:hypothetical protein
MPTSGDDMGRRGGRCVGARDAPWYVFLKLFFLIGHLQLELRRVDDKRPPPPSPTVSNTNTRTGSRFICISGPEVCFVFLIIYNYPRNININHHRLDDDNGNDYGTTTTTASTTTTTMRDGIHGNRNHRFVFSLFLYILY